MARRRRVASGELMGWITTNPLSLLGHLLQGRFGCVAMEEAHTLNALRYLAFNPVRWLSRVSITSFGALATRRLKPMFWRTLMCG